HVFRLEEELTLAFYHCHIDAQANQERILAYLLPLRLLKGHLPSDELMQRFPVLSQVFSPFSDCHPLMLTVERARELCFEGSLSSSERRNRWSSGLVCKLT
ncbi:hypothetical protein BT96DRAFT_914750, partial [Gymnopus androsaceus JB14]